MWVIYVGLDIYLAIKNGNYTLGWFLRASYQSKYQKFDILSFPKLWPTVYLGWNKKSQTFANLTTYVSDTCHICSRSWNRPLPLETFGFFGKNFFSVQPGQKSTAFLHVKSPMRSTNMSIWNLKSENIYLFDCFNV